MNKVEGGQSFFDSVSLGHIYGDRNTVQVKINKRSYMRLADPNPDVVRTEGMKIIEEHGLRGLRAAEATREGYFVYEGMPYALAWWTPHKAERELLVRLAHSLTNDTPFILDVPCGTGFLARLLATETDSRVVGLDSGKGDLLGMFNFRRLPDTPGDVALLKRDVWNVIDTLGPKYPSYLNRERRQLLRQLRREPEHEYPFFAATGINVTNERAEPLSDEIRRLQEITPLHTDPSPVDVVVCSFMPDKADLTIPIRDGIYPKCIVYVRQISGGTGAGDYFLEDLNPESLRYSQISFNPGEYYEVVARWPTPNKQDVNNKDMEKPELEDILPLRPMTAEVVVQLRKDVVPVQTSEVSLQSHPWDQEIEDFFISDREKWLFFGGINEASRLLFER